MNDAPPAVTNERKTICRDCDKRACCSNTCLANSQTIFYGLISAECPLDKWPQTPVNTVDE